MQETNTREQAHEQLSALRKGESIFLRASEENAARLWLARLEMTALENLVSSTIRQCGKPEQNPRFDELYTRYLQSRAQYEAALRAELFAQLGEELLLLISAPGNGFWYRYDTGLGAICITKHCPPPCAHGNIGQAATEA